MRILDNLIYRAEELGEIKIQYQLGLIFQTGDRVERDPVQARHWFERAAANGHEEAARALAKLDGKPLKPRAPKKKPRTEIASTQSSVEDLPPVISTKPTKPTRQTELTESKSTTTEECPHGHGPLKEWKGNLRCWTCGWSKNQSNPKAAESSEVTGAEEKPSLTAWFTKPTQTPAEDQETAADETKAKENKGADLFWIIGILFFLVAKSCG